MIQEAGADALELNIYFDCHRPLSLASRVERRYLDLVQAVKESISIPLAVKIGPFFSSMANMALRLRRRVPTVWSCSIASSSPISTWRSWPVTPQAHLEHQRRTAACPCAGLRSSAASSASRWRRRRASILLRTCSSCSWPGPMRYDDGRLRCTRTARHTSAP